MRKKTIQAICAFNIVASLFAVGWVTKPYWNPRPKPPQPMFDSAALTPAPPKDADACWREFAMAATYDAALHALAGLPAGQDRQTRAASYLAAANSAQDTEELKAATLARTARRAAALTVWAETVESGTEGFAELQRIAAMHGKTKLEREIALRSLMLAAQRRHKANPMDNKEAWRESLASYLMDGEFGRGSGVDALAVQSMAFAINEEIAPLERTKVVERLGLLLQPQNGAGESVILAAIDVGRQLQAAELSAHVRGIFERPVSDACQQAALKFIAHHGDAGDLLWLEAYVPATAALEVSAGNAWAAISHRHQATPAVAVIDRP